MSAMARLLVALKWIRKQLCCRLDLHSCDDERHPCWWDTYDGCHFHSVCTVCGKEILRELSGLPEWCNWRLDHIACSQRRPGADLQEARS